MESSVAGIQHEKYASHMDSQFDFSCYPDN
jgi:hypothetical protein